MKADAVGLRWIGRIFAISWVFVVRQGRWVLALGCKYELLAWTTHPNELDVQTIQIAIERCTVVILDHFVTLLLENMICRGDVGSELIKAHWR